MFHSKILNYSVDQSDFWNLKIASINPSTFSEREIIKEILNHEIDLIQFNLSQRNRKVYAKLLELNFYNYLNYASVVCAIDLDPLELSIVDDDDTIKLRKYIKESEEDKMKFLIYEIMKSTAPFYFRLRFLLKSTP